MEPRKGVGRLAIIALAMLALFPVISSARATPPTVRTNCIPIEAGDGCLPVAPEGKRVDLAAPTFSNPTAITNPLFPIGALDSVLMLGTVDGLPFRTEVTLLPETKMIVWNGQSIELLVSQYTAYLDGRIYEVAIDWYAQADDGAVWYFGEDVFNYEDGVVADTRGTWIAGNDGPPGMIMPGNPQVGDVYRPENIPGNVFEEVTVKSVDVTVDGPLGPVRGAIVVTELHQDGTYEDKTFAPGYGEFLTAGGGDVEAVALAVPTDAGSDANLPGLKSLATDAMGIVTSAERGNWADVASEKDRIRASWNVARSGSIPALVTAEMERSFDALMAATNTQDVGATQQAAIAIAQSALDLQLLARPVTEIDLARFDLWLTQIQVDAATGETALVTGDVATLEWMRDRLTGVFATATLDQMNEGLVRLRGAVGDDDLTAITDIARELGDLLPVQ